MSEELLSLKWNNHQSHFVDILTFLREQEIFIDATLACGGKLYPAHKFVLSTCSDYFKQMFTKNPSKHPIVFMKDVSCRDLEALLDFMYNGEVNVPQSSLGSLIKTAEGLQIKGLAVPDDPPFSSKREASLLRDRRELKAARDNSYSPSPKRLRGREKSPPIYSSRSKSPPSSLHPSSTAGVEALATAVSEETVAADEDSRTSAISDPSANPSTVKPNVNSHVNSEDSASLSDNLSRVSNRDPSPGPSGLHKLIPPQSKEEELDIKQEDVVDLGETEGDDWGGGADGEGRDESLDDGGGGDSLASENTPNFSDVLGPSSDGLLNTSGDPAMNGRLPNEAILSPPPPPQPSLPSLPSKTALVRFSMEDSLFMMPFRDNGVFNVRFREESREQYFPSLGVKPASSGLESFLERPFGCPYCSMSFKRKYTLQEHIRIHLGYRPYSCSSCGKSFTQSSSLGKHTKRNDGGGVAVMGAANQPVSNPAAALSIQGSFDSHIFSPDEQHLTVAAQSRSRNASPPSISPSSSATLAMDITPSVYRFLLESSGGSNLHHVCQATKFCPSPISSSISISSNLSISCEGVEQQQQQQQQQHHRPFPCKFCETRFKKKQHLQNHERIHTGEKYVCILCGQGFSRLHILKHHVNRKHNVSDVDVIASPTTSSSSVVQHH